MALGKQLPCEICSRSFQTKQHLEVHIRAHTGEKPYKCTICNKSFAQSSALANHKDTHSSIKKYKCDHCFKLIGTSSGLKEHMKRHLVKGKPLKCSGCSARFTDKHQLSNHFKSYHDPIEKYKFECIFCAKTFSYVGKGRFFKHILSHIGERMYSCRVCSKEFKAKSELTQHSATHHGTNRKRNFYCVFCTRTFICSKSRKNHLLIHIGEKPYICNICGFESTQFGNLQAHKIVHSKNRSISCSKCSKSYKSKDALKRHMTRHLIGRPFKCELCKWAFKSMPELRRHKHCVHTAEKLFVCQFCRKKFSLIGEMKRHIERIHAPPGKMVPCRFCSKHFKCKSYARSHERRCPHRQGEVGTSRTKRATN